jgi:16S rRNA processing protein RimM
MDARWRTLPGFIRIGSTGKTRGIDGEIKLYLDNAYINSALEAEFLFIEHNGNKVPLRIEHVREVQDVLVKFHGVNDPGAASQWASCDVFLPGDEISGQTVDVSDTDLEYALLKGFTIHDKTLGEIGSIIEIKEFPQQEMAILKHSEKEILIPLNPHFIIEIDHEGQVVHMDLPPGLLDI